MCVSGLSISGSDSSRVSTVLDIFCVMLFGSGREGRVLVYSPFGHISSNHKQTRNPEGSVLRCARANLHTRRATNLIRRCDVRMHRKACKTAWTQVELRRVLHGPSLWLGVDTLSHKEQQQHERARWGPNKENLHKSSQIASPWFKCVGGGQVEGCKYNDRG